jgi:hypothetical protein
MIVTSVAQVNDMKKRDTVSTPPIIVYHADASTTYRIYPAVTVAKRDAISTPTLVAHWPAQMISAACSLVATGTIQTTVTSTAATPVVTSTTTSNVIINTVSTSTVTAVQTTYPFSPYFYLADTNNNRFISYDGSGSSVFALIFDNSEFIEGQTDSQSRLYYGNTYFARVNSITGLDRVQLIGNGDAAHALFCTLGNRAAGTGSFTCSVGGPNGQKNILQNCNNVLYIGTSVGGGCQQVALTAFAG